MKTATQSRAWGLLLLLAALLLAPSGAAAQNKKSLPLFEQAAEKGMLGQYEEAIVLLQKAIDADPRYAEAYLLLGEQHLALGQYDEAILNYRRSLDLGLSEEGWKAQAQKGIATAEWRRHAVQNPVPFRPVNLGPNVNSAADEYLPALTADYRTMVFTRRAPRRATTRRDLPEEEDFYISLYDTMELDWGPATLMPQPLNSNGNEGCLTLSHDGRVALFSTSSRDREHTGNDIFLSVRHGDRWGQPRNVGAPVNSRYWESYPSLSVDGYTLYFASNRSGGYGGTDIWCCTLEEGRWSEPRNLGPNINTAGNETSPYIHFDDQTLYFASDGRMGMGRTDLYVSRKGADGGWGPAQNLGYPINTEGDEVGLIVAPDGRTALFSSDRFEGYGRQDLYSFVMPAPSRPGRITFIDPIRQAENLLTLGDTVTLRNIFFHTASAELVETSLAELDRLAEALKRHPRLRLEVGGHTDNVGSDADNLLLSERRAKAVYDYLIANGIDPERLTYRGYGETLPVATNDTPEGRAKNRRTTLSPIK